METPKTIEEVLDRVIRAVMRTKQEEYEARRGIILDAALVQIMDIEETSLITRVFK